MQFLRRAFLFFFLVVPLQTQAQTVADAASGPAMWQLQTEGATITFLGSFHLISPGLAWQDSRVNTALNAADSVVFEIDMALAEDPAMAQRMLAAGSLPEGEVLSQHLSADQYAELSAICMKLGIPVTVIDGYKPWFAGMVLSIVHMQIMGFDPDAGADVVLDKAARSMGKTMGALETIDDQINALAALDDLSADDIMKDSTREFDDPEYLTKMLELWYTGDVAGLQEFMLDELMEYPGLYEALLVNRNSRWIAPLERMIAGGGSHFVIVGAAHLVGEDSVIAMLRAKGHVIKRF
jgi:uncharacterized protein